MKSFSWPDNRRGAVSLRFDDGLQSHLDVAAPMLETHSFRGTFYLCPSGTEDEWQDRASLWRPVALAGHEIGNHSLSHPVPVALADGPVDRCSEHLSLEAYQSDVLEAQRRLQSAFDREQWTYCYPCYETDIGTGIHRQSVVPFIAEHFLAATAGGEVSRPCNDPRFCDLHKLLAVKADGIGAGEIVAHIERGVELGRWVIIVYHGIGQGHLAVSGHDLSKVLTYLASRRDCLWTATVAEVAGHVTAERELSRTRDQT